MRTSAWIAGILGVWLIVTAFLNFGPTVVLWHNLALGILVTAAGSRIFQVKRSWTWICWAIGVWVIIAALIPGLRTGSGYLWNNIISGIIMAFSGFGAIAERRPEVGKSAHREGEWESRPTTKSEE